MEKSRRLEVPRRFTRSAIFDEEWEIESAAWLIQFMCQRVGLADLRDTELLDMGCGVKFTKLFVNNGVPIKRYVGIDVYREMIEFLQASLDDPRFEYFHINVKNDRYNPAGEPFCADLRLPIGDAKFDLICLFSVFTHLAPDDYRTMLQLVRRYVRPDGRLFFSLIIDELTDGGHGAIDSLSRAFEADPQLLKSAPSHTRRAEGGRPIERFRDADPARPLLGAIYSEEYARELIEGTSWRVVNLSQPDVYIQHSFVCAPI
jgi:SAM-dependent methyltransferase